jgi:hypothetical protein
MHLGTNYSATTMVRENVEVTNLGGEFIALRDQAEGSHSLGMGDNVVRKDGLLLIDIYTPQDTGTARSRTIGDILAGLLENQVIESITFGESELHTAGNVKDTQYFQQVLQTPYTFLYGAENVPCQY